MKREVSTQSSSRQALLPNGASASLSSPPSTNSTGPNYVDTLPNDEEQCDLKKLKKHKARQYSVTAVHLPSDGTSSQGSFPIPLNRHHSPSKEVSSKANLENTVPSLLTMDISSPAADSFLGEPVRLSEPTPRNQSSALASISPTLLSEAPLLFNHLPPKSKQYHALARRRSSSALPSLTLPSAVLLNPNSVIMKSSSPTIEMTSICVEGEIYCNSSGTSTPVSPGSPCFATTMTTTTSPMNVYPDHLSSTPSITTTSNPPKLHSIADSQPSNISCTDNQNTRQNTITRRRSVRKPASTMSKIPIRRSINFLSPQDSLSHSSSPTSLPSATLSTEASTTKSSSSSLLSSSLHIDSINSSIPNHNYDNNNDNNDLASRPPLHTYTSFETTFDLRPPPSPPQTAGKLPNATDRCHKSVTESNSSASGSVSGILVGVGSWW